MGASSSIQIRGRDNVVEAYRSRDIDVWSVWQGRQFLTKGTGEQDLAEFLDMLLRSGSNAIYTIRVYEDLTDPKAVKSNTADSGSINFRLIDPQQNEGMGGFGGGTMQQQVNALNDKFEKLLDIMARREEEEEIEDEEDQTGEAAGVTGAVIGLLKDPDKLGKFIDIVRPIFNPGAYPAGQVGNVNRLAPAGANVAPGSDPSLSPSPEMEQQRLQRIYSAVDRLDKADPHLADHLEKLATMATANPGGFSNLVGMLDIF